MSITSITSNISARIAAGVLGLAVAFGFAFALTAPVQADTSMCPSYSWTRNLQVGSTGADVMKLQQYLNSSAATQIAASGAGSPGAETSYFGNATKAAVMKFQTANGISPVAGFVGPLTRAKINAMCAGTTGTTVPTTPTSGTGLMVSAAAQPANGLAPASALRIPFTNFTVTAGNDGDVTVNGVTVERKGASTDASFAGVVLIDQATGQQVGISKTLNSNHQAVLGETIVIPRGTTKTFTVAANRATAGSRGGEVASFAVVSINTSAAVSGSLPIMGASHTINETLTIGSVSTSSSSFDPGSAQTKNIGDTSVRFTGLRFTAGSGEDVKLYSIRFRQVGSVSSSDLANVVINVNSVDYPAMVDSTGKYYTASFPGGIFVAKGNSIDAYIRGDIIGSNAAGRNVDFDIDKVTDVYFIGQLYGYGIGFSPSYTNTPWQNGYVVTVNAGTATTISKANEVAAQNIAVNVQNQTLGGFATDFKGEAVSVQSMSFTVATSSGVGMLTNVSIVDQNGSVVAGPVDQVGTTVTFGDSVTFKTGRSVYTIKGRVASGSTNGGTITLSTTPSSWSSPVGQTSGNTVSLSSFSTITLNTMTVRTATLAVAVSSDPSTQSIVAGAQSQLFANYQFDASQSGEDVRFSSVAVNITGTATTSLTGCVISENMGNGTFGSALGTAQTISSPSGSNSTQTFTFDNPYTVTKGSVKTLALRCNVSSSQSSNGTYLAGMTSAQIAALGVTGFPSSSSVTATGSTQNGQTMTVGTSGTLLASTDSSSPSYAVGAGSSEVTLGVYKLRASNEAVNLNRIGLKLTNAASSSAADLTQVSLTATVNGVTTNIGSATFVGGNMNATSTLSSTYVLPKDTDVVITVKGTIAGIGSNQQGVTGHLVAVDVDTNGTNTQGTGAQSGATVNATGSTSVAGVRIYKSFPVLAKASVPTNTLNNGQQSLLRFTVSANAKGDVGVGKVTLRFATTSITSLTGVNVYAFTDAAYSVPVSGLRSDGALLASDTDNPAVATDIQVVASTPVQVPANSTRYFEVRGTIAGAITGSSIQTSLQGDAAYAALAGFDDTLTNIDADANDDFIWSPNTTGTSAAGDADWVNGFGLIGLPSSNMSSEVLSK